MQAENQFQLHDDCGHEYGHEYGHECGNASEGMPRRFLPGLGVLTSAIGAGCWTIGGPAVSAGVPIGWDGVDPGRAYAGLVRAHELGVRLFDTADAYGLGRSERLLGRLLTGIDRTSVTVCSKVGYIPGPAPSGLHASLGPSDRVVHPYQPEQMLRQFHTTLENLGTGYLDVYHLHSSDFGPGDRHLPGVLGILADLRSQGLIKAVGIRAPHTFAEQWAIHPPGPCGQTGLAQSRTDKKAGQAARFLQLFHAVRPDVITVRYNLLSPLYPPGETDIFRFAERHRAGVIVKQALGQGLLTGRDLTPLTYGRGDHRTRDPQFTPAALAALSRRLRPLRDRYDQQPGGLLRVALRYILQTAPASPVLTGFRDAQQIQATIRTVTGGLTSAGDPLTGDDLTFIRDTLHPTTKEDTTP